VARPRGAPSCVRRHRDRVRYPVLTGIEPSFLEQPWAGYPPSPPALSKSAAPAKTTGDFPGLAHARAGGPDQIRLSK